jgi:glycosyltransferase involved in cell wall biosynthesis
MTGVRAGGRYSSELGNSDVKAFNLRAFLYEARLRCEGISGWQSILKRNDWFQECASEWLERTLNPNSILFAYSYAARDLFRVGKARGCQTILGQIDPGILEEQIVSSEVSEFPTSNSGFERAPSQYWAQWREECQLADAIVVNSSWSASALKSEGVTSSKLHVIPLAYSEDSDLMRVSGKEFPAAFTPSRPLRVLFLGQVIPRKGIYRLLQSAQLLSHEPIEFTVVGEAGSLMEELRRHRNIVATGAVPRREVSRFYKAADVFLFPTLSDGFGLTLLEAARWGLPIICSNRCGEVIEHNVNGCVLSEITADVIAESLTAILREPKHLYNWSSSVLETFKRFTLEHLGKHLVELCDLLMH